MLKIVSDSLEYFGVTVQNFSTKEPKRSTCLSWRVCQDAVQLLKLYERILSLQCEHIKHALHKPNGDNLIAQCTQQLQKTTARQLTVLNFVVSSYQDQVKSDKNAKECDRNSRLGPNIYFKSTIRMVYSTIRIGRSTPAFGLPQTDLP